ncbi:MAG: hypothetical protein M0C28_07095 [Candidatus Moduliflexus flocculans]|nr:hypothetical protein [Candidatus Moduliflexus flocculans]
MNRYARRLEERGHPLRDRRQRRLRRQRGDRARSSNLLRRPRRPRRPGGQRWPSCAASSSG